MRDRIPSGIPANIPSVPKLPFTRTIKSEENGSFFPDTTACQREASHALVASIAAAGVMHSTKTIKCHREALLFKAVFGMLFTTGPRLRDSTPATAVDVTSHYSPSKVVPITRFESIGLGNAAFISMGGPQAHGNSKPRIGP
jgi:hypothetical protein